MPRRTTGGCRPTSCARGGVLWTAFANGAVRGAVTVAGGAVLVGSTGNRAYSFESGTGAQRWVFTTGGPVGSSPAAAYGLVFVASDDGNLVALEERTGQPVWVAPRRRRTVGARRRERRRLRRHLRRIRARSRCVGAARDRCGGSEGALLAGRGRRRRVRGLGGGSHRLDAVTRRGRIRAPLPRSRRPQAALAFAAPVHLSAIKLRGFKSFPDPVEVRLEPGVARRRRPERLGEVERRRRDRLGRRARSRRASCAPRSPTTSSSRARRTAAAGRLLRGRAASSTTPTGDGPVEFSELSIARRLHRGGEGQYLVNRATRPAHRPRRAARRPRPRRRDALDHRAGQGRGDPRRRARSGAASCWRRRPASAASSAAGTAPS